MFNKDWWRKKNKSQELTIGWLYNDNIKDDFAKGYTRNLTDYWATEMSWYLPFGFEDSKIDTLLKKAYLAGYRKIIVFKQGTTLGTFQTEFPKFYDKNKDATFVGHILDQQDSYYSIHPQAFMLDLVWWANAEFPEWGVQFGYSIEESFETEEPIRSIENWHDKYTPHWIAPGTTLKTYKEKLTGWNMVRALLKDRRQIISWNKEIRESKHYSYPEVAYDGPRHLAGIMSQLLLDIFFIANTELPPPKLQFLIDKRKAADSTWDGTFKRLVVPAAGLSALIYAFKLKMQPGSSIYVYDISKFGLDVTRTIIEKWDGTNYSEFAKKIMKDFSPDPSRRRDVFRGSTQLKDSDTTIEELNKEGFQEWLTEILPKIEIFYNPVNILDPTRSKKFIGICANDDVTTYVHLSNIYHYMPTAFFYSLQQRWVMHNELLGKYKAISNNNNLLIYSACPVGHRHILSWVDDIDHTISFDDLPNDTRYGKLLRWNKPTK